MNGTDPVIRENLIPITLSNDGTVTYADTKKEWYNYGNKVWANAVILVEAPSKTYSVGDTILESDIESYFVWIPRYKYQIFNEGNYTTYSGTEEILGSAKTINIIFENKETTVSTGSTVGTYLTHPSFTTLDVNGMWVGKFETTGDTSNVTIKPNLTSLRNLNVASMFDLAINYESSLNSHMMKNTEWGAVAYLSHSVYGINKEININNNSDYLTGYSAVEETDQSSYPGTSGKDSSVTLAYNTKTGYKASTTGNISGVYDMSGGSHEYMAAYMDGQFGNSGLTQKTINTNSKYFDIYSSSSNVKTYNYRILGDATGEMGPFYYYEDKDSSFRYHSSWYSDHSHFVDSSYPMFLRGGNYAFGSLAGTFNFHRTSGGADTSLGFRLVLAP